MAAHAIPPLRIALSGGGMKGISHVGALEALNERGLLRCVKEYLGTSSGALISFCVVLGYSLQELRTLCTLFDFTRMQNLDPEFIFQFPEQFGLDNGENLERLLAILLRAKGYDPATTFENLNTPLALRIFAVDVNSCKMKEFSVKTTPRAEVRMAVRASMAVPFFFTPVKESETGHILVDGGVIAHFPFHHLSPEERENTYGIAFSDLNRAPTEVPDNIGNFIFQLYYAVYHQQNAALFNEWKHRIIIIPCGEFPMLNFGASVEDKTGLIESGRKGVEDFFAYKVRVKQRRKSVA
jgi:NTE family protein